MKELAEIKPQFPDDSVLPQPQFSGRQLFKAPQQKLTAPAAGSLTSGTSSPPMVDTDAIILENLRVRVTQIETALVNLGLLNSR